MSRLPVQRHKHGKKGITSVLWKDRALTLEDFNEVREYVDACLNPSSVDEGMTLKLTIDFHLLRHLVQVLDALIPWATPKEAKRALEILTDRPVRPRPPSGSTQTARSRRKLALRRAQYEVDQKAWKKAIREYEANIEDWKARHSLYLELKERCLPHKHHKKIIQRLLHDLDRVIDQGGLVFERVKWKILPPGDSLSASVRRYLTAAKARYPTRRQDQSRINCVLTLKPAKAYVGIGEFDGYMVFLFNQCPYAVLECPWVGNALYLLKGNWTVLSKLPKSTLLHRHHRDVARIIHDDQGAWFGRLATVLNRRPTRRHA